MKTLLLVRHAKSCWDDEDLPDLERPLNHRGLCDAPDMGQRLKHRGLIPDSIVSSHAVRAVSTAVMMAAEMDFERQRIRIEENLYGASLVDVLEIVTVFPETVSVAMVVGHNPTMTTLANHFSNRLIENVPTCGVLRIHAKAWSDVSQVGRLVEFDYPKNVS